MYINIDHIRTDLFSIGCFGRSGSKTIAEFLSGYYADYYSGAKRLKFLHNADTLGEKEFEKFIESINDKEMKKLVRDISIPHHNMSLSSIENYNNFQHSSNPKILVLRDPIERAKSGSSLGLEKNFHGAPVLSYIDFDSVDYIIDFNKLNEYTNYLRVGSHDEDKKIIDHIVENNLIPADPKHRLGWMNDIWNHEDFDYITDIELYNNALEKKEQLPLDLWKSLVRNIGKINIPTRREGIAYMETVKCSS